jgi:hypothetical protein
VAVVEQLLILVAPRELVEQVDTEYLQVAEVAVRVELKLVLKQTLEQVALVQPIQVVLE